MSVLAVALAACSGDGPGPGGGGPGPGPGGPGPIDTATLDPDGTPNPCALVSDADLAAALATEAGERDQGSEGEAEFCRVLAADRAAFASLDLFIEPGGRPVFELLKQQAAERYEAFAEIEGVGDAAFRIQADDRGAEVAVLKGAYIVHINLVVPFSSAGAEGRALDLAAVIVAGM
jgi:hypothetical protein